jgi:hypothetical protein
MATKQIIRLIQNKTDNRKEGQKASEMAETGAKSDKWRQKCGEASEVWQKFGKSGGACGKAMTRCVFVRIAAQKEVWQA